MILHSCAWLGSFFCYPDVERWLNASINITTSCSSIFHGTAWIFKRNTKNKNSVPQQFLLLFLSFTWCYLLVSSLLLPIMFLPFFIHFILISSNICRILDVFGHDKIFYYPNSKQNHKFHEHCLRWHNLWLLTFILYRFANRILVIVRVCIRTCACLCAIPPYWFHNSELWTQF